METEELAQTLANFYENRKEAKTNVETEERDLYIDDEGVAHSENPASQD